MVQLSDIIDAVGALLGEAVPGLAQYVGGVPEAYSRPCLCLEASQPAMEPAGRGLVRISADCTVAIAPPADPYGEPDLGGLRELVARVLDAFSAGFVRVGDRAIKLGDLWGETENDVGFVDFSLNFFDDRPMGGETPPTAVSVETNIKEGDR